MSTKTKDKKVSFEFWLIVAMLVALIFLVGVILYTPILGEKTENFDASTILDYRSNLFSGLLTAFGAWIGAGAAYFFGRESLREAYDGMKSLQQPSITERLTQLKIKDMPPKDLTWRPTRSKPLQAIFDKLDQNPDYWFIPIFDEADKLKTVKSEDTFWNYYRMKMDEKPKAEIEKTVENIKKMSIGDFLDDIEKPSFAEKFKRFTDPHVLLKLTDSIHYANKQLDEKGVYLAIINDEEGNARYYATASEFRRYMASI